MSLDKSICPVPKDQVPINEYLALKKSFGFSWTTDSDSVYYQTSLKIYFIGLILFASLINTNNISLIQVFVYSIFTLSTILLFFYLRIYLGWGYIYRRLMQATVAYEESGWYDGQVWVKTPEVLIKDKLAGEYQVKPILNRIKNTLLILTFLIFIALYFIFVSNKI